LLGHRLDDGLVAVAGVDAVELREEVEVRLAVGVVDGRVLALDDRRDVAVGAVPVRDRSALGRGIACIRRSR